MPDTRPRITFDQDGICNACLYAETKAATDWDDRRREFLELVEPHRSKDGCWDCVVPWSGGKDSSTIAYRLKFEFGLNPLLVTFAPLIPSQVGMHNREALIQAGFDHLYFRTDQRVMRRLARRFFIERGNQKVAWDAGINAIPVRVALKFRIPVVFYAEHGESEYGGKIISKESQKIRDYTEVIEHQIGDDPRNWLDEEITLADLNPYIYPDLEEIRKANLTAFYFGYFFRHSMVDKYNFIKDKIDFHTCAEGRTEGTFTDFDSLDDKTDNLYYYMQFIKFGFGRATRDACRMIQNGQLSREQALDYARKYDSEFPARHIEENLEYMKLNREEFSEIVDKHRNDEIWAKENGGWKLRFPPS